jgi:hypothetical protein
MKPWKKMTKAERQAWEAHLDETVRTLRELVRKGRDELGQKQAAGADPKTAPQ